MAHQLRPAEKAVASGGDPLSPALISALRTIDVEQRGIEDLKRALQNGLGEPFRQAVDLILSLEHRKGRLIVSGMGKSGHVGGKIAATMASTGTPSYFVHPAEASHGDLGMITPDDAVLALSWSGETAELTSVVTYAARFRVPLIAFTSRKDSTLARAADILFVLPAIEEACPHGLAPTTSTITQIALGDALAIALLESRGFSAQDFRVFHPGGQLGANLNFVRDIMHARDDVPVVGLNTTIPETIKVMSGSGFGCVLIVDEANKLEGIITDGDIRRHLGPALMERKAAEVMTAGPQSVEPGTMVGKAMEIMNSNKITALPVCERGRLMGLVHMHDLLKIGLR